MRIVFEIKESLSDIINEILTSDRWIPELREKLHGRKKYVIPSILSPSSIFSISNKKIRCKSETYQQISLCQLIHLF